MHAFCHVQRFFYNEAYQLLRGSHHYNAIYRNGLEHRQRNIAGSWRHIYKQKIQFSPYYVTPELFYHVSENRPSPNHRGLFIRKKQVNGHNLNSIRSHHRLDKIPIHLCRTVNTIHLRNGWSCNISVQNSYFVSLGCHLICQRCGYHGFTNATFAADHTDYLVYMGFWIRRRQHALRLLCLCCAWTSFTALSGTGSGAAACIFCHFSISFFYCIFYRKRLHSKCFIMDRQLMISSYISCSPFFSTTRSKEMAMLLSRDSSILFR